MKHSKWILATFHPELQPGEVLFSNACSTQDQIALLKMFKSSRIGNRAYTLAPMEEQELLPEKCKPIFVLRHEVAQQGYAIYIYEGGYIPVPEKDEELMGGRYNISVEHLQQIILTNSIVNGAESKTPNQDGVKEAILVTVISITILFLSLWLLIAIVAAISNGSWIWIWPLN